MLTPEQERNRARALVAVRVVSGFLALGVGANLVNGLRDGYIKLGLGDRRGPGGDFILLDTRLGMAVGGLLLEVVAVFLAIVAISPRSAMRPRVLLSSIGAVTLATAVLHFFFE